MKKKTTNEWLYFAHKMLFKHTNFEEKQSSGRQQSKSQSTKLRPMIMAGLSLKQSWIEFMT